MCLPISYLLLSVDCDAFLFHPLPFFSLHTQLFGLLPAKNIYGLYYKREKPVPIIVTYSFHLLCVVLTYNQSSCTYTEGPHRRRNSAGI